MFGAGALAALGGGLTLPYLVVYLHEVRGIGLALAGLAMSGIAAAGVIGNPLGGWASDRVGARATLVCGLLLAAAGALGLGAVRDVWHAFAAIALVGLGAAIMWPAHDALAADAVAPGQRSNVFAVRYGVDNAALSVGVLIAAALVDVARPSSFEFVYRLEAASALASPWSCSASRRSGGLPAPPPARAAGGPAIATSSATGCSCGCGR